MHPLNASQLRELLCYDPTTGTLTWRPRAPHWFKRESEKECAKWNRQFAGKSALTNINDTGYQRGTILCRGYLAHRVIWCMCYGYWPIEVDHDNGVRTDNRYLNLKDGSHADNMKNIKRRTDNSSGVAGVSWDKRYRKWCAEITVNGKKIHLGYFSDLSQAERIRIESENRHGFNTAHGKR